MGREPIYVDFEARCDAKAPDLAKYTVDPPPKQPAAAAAAADVQPASQAPATPPPPPPSAPAAPPKKAAGAGKGAGKGGAGKEGDKKRPSAHEALVAASSVHHATQRLLDLVRPALSSCSRGEAHHAAKAQCQSRSERVRCHTWC